MLHKLSFALLFAVLTCGQIASAQLKQSGKCPKVKLTNEFIWPYFEGVWFEYAKYPIYFESGWECVYGTYRAIAHDTIKVRVLGYRLNQPVFFDLTGKILGPGIFFVTVNENGLKRTDKILDTDYKSWAVIYSCEEDGEVRAERAWILTRERIPKADAVTTAMAVLSRNGIDKYYLNKTYQKNCPN